MRRVAISGMAYPLIEDRKTWEGQNIPPDILEAQEAINWAEHLLVYPLWHGDMLAQLKGFFEQVFRPGFAFDPNACGRIPRKQLKGRTARIVVTIGMPAPVYRLFFGAHSVRSLERNILSFVGIRPVRRVLIGSVEGQARARARWLHALHAWGAAGASLHRASISFPGRAAATRSGAATASSQQRRLRRISQAAVESPSMSPRNCRAQAG